MRAKQEAAAALADKAPPAKGRGGVSSGVRGVRGTRATAMAARGARGVPKTGT